MAKFLVFFSLMTLGISQQIVDLLPPLVTIENVKRIEVTTTGAVYFSSSTDGSSSVKISSSDAYTRDFDSASGLLSIKVNVPADELGAASTFRPCVILFALLSISAKFSQNPKYAFFLIFALGVGIVTAFAIVDVTVILPHDCFFPAGSAAANVYPSSNCSIILRPVVASNQHYVAPGQPIASLSMDSTEPWEPVTPAYSFLPAHDNPTHSLSPADQYQVWRSKYGKAYDYTEYTNFLSTVKMCLAFNSNLTRSWTMGCTQFAGQSFSDWKTNVLANNNLYLSTQKVDPSAGTPGRRLLQTLPASFSWIGTGKLTPVKDQGQCGSCYTHSSTSQMEAAANIAMGTVSPAYLSREQLKNCADFTNCGGTGCGCDGGYPENMFVYAAQSQGITSEANYPYVTSNANCKSPLPGKVANLTSPGPITIANNELAFKAALQNGPIAISVSAQTWNSYVGGVFTGCGTVTMAQLDHAVLLVGYGTDPTLGMYWIIQNSWATSWGEKGMIRVPRTDKSTSHGGGCGLTLANGYQAKGAKSTLVNAADCQGSWSPWSPCSTSCGTTGTQSSTWTTTKASGAGGAACPSPTTKTQSCNVVPCPAPPSPPTTAKPTTAGTTSSTCIKVKNTVLSTTGNGYYSQTAGWNQNFCGTAKNPEYIMTKAGQSFSVNWFTSNCKSLTSGGVTTYTRTMGTWGLGNYPSSASYYQSSASVSYGTPVVGSPNWTTSPVPENSYPLESFHLRTPTLPLL